MKDLYIIDGYNFIFKNRKPQEFSSGQISYLREKFLRQLAEFQNFNSCSVIAVFDAKRSLNFERSRMIQDNIEIIYSKNDESADSIVESIVHSNKSYDRIFVVTSDYLQQKVVFKKNIYRKSIREFACELKESSEKISGKLLKQKYFSEKSFYSVDKRIDKGAREKLDRLRKSE